MTFIILYIYVSIFCSGKFSFQLITTPLLLQDLFPSFVVVSAVWGVAQGGRVADGGAEVGGGDRGGGGELLWEGAWVLVQVTTLPAVFIGQHLYHSQQDFLIKGLDISKLVWQPRLWFFSQP